MHDDNLGCLIAVVCGVVILAIAIWEARGRNRRRAQHFLRLARLWNGKAVGLGTFSEPILRINVDGTPGEVTFKGGRGSPWTRIDFNWGSERRLRVVPEGVTAWLKSLFGSGDLKVGSREFDSAYWVESTDAEWARDVLSPGIREHLLKLRSEGRVYSSNPVTLFAGPRGLFLKVGRLLVDRPDALERFIELGVMILREARDGGASVGVVVASVETQTGSECPVCGHVVDRGRACPSCRTPHHDDCWKYMDGCAIFACSGRKGAA